MKTADGYLVNTSGGYPVVGKDPDDYNYPLYALFSTPKTYTAEIFIKTYTVVMDP